MTIANALAHFQAELQQCNSLIATAHRVDAAGAPIFAARDREQITVAAFLNVFIAWEFFLEETLSQFMSGAPTIGGVFPVRYVMPLDTAAAKRMVVGVNRYFDYGNYQYFRKIVGVMFPSGGPFEPHIATIQPNLDDLRAMRNASAHISSSTQASLEAVAQRLLGTPRPGIRLYELLTSMDPTAAGNTIYESHRNLLEATASLVANG